MLKNNLLLSFALLALAPIKIYAQQNSTAIVTSLNKVIKPIQSLRGDTSFADILFLKETLKDKELIALGEVTHGTAEVFNYKDRLIRFLVTNLGYRNIAFESDFIAIEHMDNYITGKADSIIYLAGTAIMKSNNSMIEWLRLYNRNKPEADKVHIYGLEVRNYTNIFKKLLAVIPHLDKTDKDLIEAYLAKPFNSELTRQEMKSIKSIISKLQTTKLSDINRHYVEMLYQLVGYEGKMSVRDSYMAKNATWLKERARDNKLIIWAHNGHLTKTELYNHPSLGTHLNKKYGSKYYVIGTDFNSGKAYVNVFIAKNKPLLGFQPYYFGELKSEKWYEYFFNQCQYKNFILDIDAASSDAVLDQFLTKPLRMRSIGALSSPESKTLSISKNYDLIVYFDKTTSI
ncbi:erythromycin esterase family protein [Pedobacter nyackensis]|uniref:Erythromycin esterase n=1 Tax=Pedobacter nyackensis TaxID=475255 RepID=A0A1W2EKD8_9SPHI|nr:erythromycin esterase family protein [Pedobacter nyackensis]SMD10157.1 Erythromycin esterase [Pedobacter nyackensis]